MKKSLLSLLFLSLFALSSAFAQSRKITGTVTGADDGQPLPGVSVKVQGTGTGTQTSAQGTYTLTVPSTAKALVFSYVGYTTQVENIGTKATVNVKLVTDAKTLSEVVVTGYGTQSKREVTGSVSSIRGGDFADLPVQSLDKAIQGRAAGVQVTSQSGQPGGGITVNIRGVATINGTTQPLYIIDGIQVNSGNLSGQTSVNALSSINPDDIESIDILKDAASAAVYGALAANGVVIITTKHGRAGKTQINASVQIGQSQAYNPYQVLNAADWFQLRTESFVNVATRTGASVSAAIASANASISSLYPGNVIPATLPSYDWVKGITQTGKLSQYDLSLSGGDPKTKFFVSGSFNSTDGTVINSSFTRGTFRGNLEHTVSDHFSIQSSFNLTGSSEVGPTTTAGFFTNGYFTGTLFTPPVNPIYNPDGTYNTVLVGINSLNEIQNAALEERRVGTFQTVDNLALTYKFFTGLSFKAFGGLDFADLRELNYRPATLPVAASSLGTGNETYRRNINYNLTGTFNFNKTIGDHSLSAIAGVEYRSVTFNTLSAGAQGFSSPLFDLVSNASTPTSATSTFSGYKVAGILGSISYKYKDKYFLQGNMRDDGSSRFGASHKFGLFYGVSAGWEITKEDFMKSIDFITQLKPRVGYGVVGELPTADFGSIAQYGNGGQYGNPALLGGLRPAALPVPDLTWERSAQSDIGLDFGFLNNRITGSFDVYRKTNNRLILNEQLPGDSGFTGINLNAGTAKSEGYDLQINTVNVDMKGFRWNTTFNLGYNRTKLIELYNGLQQIGTYQYTVGQPLNLIYTYKWAGVNPADGRPMYYDINGNITYSPKTTDQQIIGHQYPTLTGGISNTFSYKGASLDFLFQYQYGNSSYLQSLQYIETSGDIAANQTINQLQRWTTPGQITSVPRPYNGGTEPNGYNIQNLSSRFVEDASYIRLKTVTFNYMLPKTLTQSIGIPSLSLFVSGLNLVTFTHYRGDDPENTGNNLNNYPNPKTISGGLKARF